MAEKLKGALFSGSAAIKKDYGYVVKPVFNPDGVHPVLSSGNVGLTMGDLAKFNPACQAQQIVDQTKSAASLGDTGCGEEFVTRED